MLAHRQQLGQQLQQLMFAYPLGMGLQDRAQLRTEIIRHQVLRVYLGHRRSVSAPATSPKPSSLCHQSDKPLSRQVRITVTFQDLSKDSKK